MNKKRITILTGSEFRHQFFRNYLAISNQFEIVHSYCEGQEKSLWSIVERKKSNNSIRLNHLTAREQSEEDFFRLFHETNLDHSNPIFLPKAAINNSKYSKSIIESKTDILVAYGCSIISEPLLRAFKGRFLNVHLGLSPYYRGAGTNYWPLVNSEPEYVGVTFMHIDASIDTGEIIHQIRAKYCWGDTPSQVGNRLILEMSRLCKKIILNFDKLENMSQLPMPSKVKVYRMKDFTEKSVEILYNNFNNGLINTYLNEEEYRCVKAPIITNPGLDLRSS